MYYETIEEEMSNASSRAQSVISTKSSPTTHQPVFVVDSDTVSIHSSPEESTRDDERGITTLRERAMLCEMKLRMSWLRLESKRTWLDTPFSLSALQGMCVSFCNNSFHHQLSKHQEVQALLS
jgi:serine/arginine repetitive matrix protein 2